MPTTGKQDPPLASGLYLVGTPIGNLEDITLRALRVLGSADRLLCEDTRQTQHLLQHFGLEHGRAEHSGPAVLSCHEHNEEARAAEVVSWLQAGERIAFVSDAGLPGISDPGMRLARAAVEAGLPVIPIPGANAALTALVGAGIETESFLFCGFLPAKPGARLTELERLARMIQAGGKALPLVFYEAPHRILDTLGDVATVWGADCKVVLARELTKLHEEFLRGTAGGVRSTLEDRERVRGEMVLLVEASGAADQQQGRSQEALGAHVSRLMSEEKLSEMDAVKRAARERGMGKSEAYRVWQRERSKTRRP